MNLREEAKSCLNKRAKMPFVYLQGLSLIGVVSSAFIALWYDLTLAFKVCLSSFILLAVFTFVVKIIEQSINQVVDEMEEPKLQESRFAKRLHEKQNEKK
jgi:hypothetical protein